MAEIIPPSVSQQFDRKVSELGMQSMIRQNFRGSRVLHPVRAYLRGRPEASFALAYMMPSRYGEPDATKEQTKQSLRRAGLRQLSTLYGIRPMEELPVISALWRAYRNQDHDLPADPPLESDWQRTLEDDLAEVLQERNTLFTSGSDSYALDTEERRNEAEAMRRTFNFLGMESAEEFAAGIDGAMEDLISESISGMSFTDDTERKDATDSAISSYRKTAEFTRTAYAHMDQPIRESAGEPSYFHPYRVTWYMLTYLKHTGTLPQTPEELTKIIQVTMSHDVFEDLGRTPEQPRTGKAWAEFDPANGLDQDDTPVDLIVRGRDGNEVARLGIDGFQLKTLKALSSNDDRTYLQKSIKDDPSGLAALGKMFDRLDNLLTYPQSAKWDKVMAKIVESFTSMGQITLHARNGKGLARKAADVTGIMRRGSFERDLPLNVLSYAMFLNAACKIGTRFREYVAEKGRGDLRDYERYERVRQLQSECGGVRLDQVSDRFPLKRIVDHYLTRWWKEHGDGPMPRYRHLFSFEDVERYLDEITDTFIYSSPVVLDQPGCPEILFAPRPGPQLPAAA
jgi:hypothetical protein